MNTEYTVTREIEDVEFSKQYVDNRRDEVRKQLIDEGVRHPSDAKVERMVKEELKKVAKDMTLNDQGDNRLHIEISYGEVKDE